MLLWLDLNIVQHTLIDLFRSRWHLSWRGQIWQPSGIRKSWANMRLNTVIFSIELCIIPINFQIDIKIPRELVWRVKMSSSLPWERSGSCSVCLTWKNIAISSWGPHINRKCCLTSIIILIIYIRLSSDRLTLIIGNSIPQEDFISKQGPGLWQCLSHCT